MTAAHPSTVTADRRSLSRAAFARARGVIPGGVNSPARAFGGTAKWRRRPDNG